MLPLPQELTDMIIRHLQLPTDHSSLLACCLVCHAFLPVALSKLHFAVYIRKRNVRRASERLTPNVAQYVRELYLHSFHQNFSWLSEGPLVVILRQLFRLQKIRLHRFTWPALSSDLRVEILHILQGRYLRHIQVFGIRDLPITVLQSFVGLKHLEISSVTLEAPSQEPRLAPSTTLIHHLPIGLITPHDNPPVYLESLGLAVLSGELPSVGVGTQNRDMISILDFLLKPETTLNVTCLRSISFDTNPLAKEFEHGLGRLLDACSATVSCVKIHGPLYTDTNPFNSTYISLKKLRCLESLVILIPHVENDVMRWLAHVLGTLDPSSCIRDVQIVLVIHDDHLQVADNEWKALDTTLTRATFASLPRLIVEWSVFPGALTLDEAQGVAFENLVKYKLPLLTDRNILEVRKMQLTHNDLFSLD